MIKIYMIRNKKTGELWTGRRYRRSKENKAPKVYAKASVARRVATEQEKTARIRRSRALKFNDANPAEVPDFEILEFDLINERVIPRKVVVTLEEQRRRKYIEKADSYL